MAERVDIANNALSFLGANLITSIDDESTEAILVNVAYDLARDSVLEAFDWTFAINRFQPALSSVPNLYGPTNRFKIPPDIMRVLSVDDGRGDGENQREQVYWQLEGDHIITNEGAILCRGIQRVEEEGLFSNLFASAFYARLAMQLAYPLTESTAKFQAAGALYEGFLSEAVTRDGQQGRSMRIRHRTVQKARAAGNRYF